MCISASPVPHEVQITAYAHLDVSQNSEAHIDAYLQLVHIENTKNSLSSISSDTIQFLSSIFDTPVPSINIGEGAHSVFAGKKYKPVAQKIRAVLADLPEKFRIVQNIVGDPLQVVLPQFWFWLVLTKFRTAVISGPDRTGPCGKHRFHTV